MKAAENDKQKLELIKSKERNLVYFNVPESSSESIEERMKFDFKTFVLEEGPWFGVDEKVVQESSEV